MRYRCAPSVEPCEVHMIVVDLCDETGAELHENDVVFVAVRPDSHRSLLIHGDVVKALPREVKGFEAATRPEHDGFNIHQTVLSMGLFEPDDFACSISEEDARKYFPNIAAILCPVTITSS